MSKFELIVYIGIAVVLSIICLGIEQGTGISTFDQVTGCMWAFIILFFIIAFIVALFKM
jgi:hypothetical protein